MFLFEPLVSSLLPSSLLLIDYDSTGIGYAFSFSLDVAVDLKNESCGP
jgi:hypothetical protein